MGNGDAPQIDFDNAKTQAQNIHDTLISLFSQMTTPGFISEMVASSAAGLFFVVALIMLPVMQVAIAIGSFIAGSFLETLATAKEEQREDLNNLLADTVNEMLGTDLQGSQLSGGSGAGADMDANQAIGNSILGIFEGTFGGGGPVTPQQGADNARKFAGFGVNFAASQGFLSILTEAASLGFFKEFHELPDGLMRALGISRLQRLALQPLIKNAIQMPYEKYCLAQFRPVALGEAQLVKALHSGQMSDGDVRQALQQLGYPDELIEFVLTDFASRIGLSDLILLLNNGDITEEDVINNLTLGGMPEDQAQLQLKAAQLGPVKSQQSELLSWAQGAYISGEIKEADWNSILQSLMLGDLEEQSIRAKVGWMIETPRKALSFADVKSAIVNGVVDFSYVDQWLTNEGYDSQAQLILNFEILQAITNVENKQLFAKYKAGVLRAAGKPIPPWITAAESAT